MRGIGRRAVLAATLAAPAVRAQTAAPFRIGVSVDMSGLFSDVQGPGQVVAARLAAEDFGGRVLGRPIEIVSADDQNRPDVGGTTVRRWFDLEGVSAVVGGGNTTVATAILGVARERDRAFMIVAAGNPDFTGRNCAPVTTHWAYDTHSAAASTGRFLSGPGRSWFFITANYAFGHALERDVTKVVETTGGRVVGAVRVPLNTPDWSSFLAQARASRADVVGLAVAGADLIGCVKQVAEFGLSRQQRVVSMIALVSDVAALGPEAAEGLIASESFYWNRNDASRAWARRWMAQRPGKVPNMMHAHAYSATLHYLKAVAASGTDAGAAVTARMKAMPVSDFNLQDVAIRRDGRVMNPTFLLRARGPDPARDRFDVFDVLGEVPGEQIFRTEAEGGCTLPAF